MSTNNGVNTSLSGQTGTGNFVGSTSPTLTTPKILTQINDTNGNEIIGLIPTGSAVNNIQVVNSATGQSPVINTIGSDSNIILKINGKGTGGVAITGTSTNDNAASGYVGEVISSTVSFGSAVNFSNNTSADLTSISLTAGDWDVYGNIYFTSAAGNPIANARVWINSTSVTAPDNSLVNQVSSNSNQYSQLGLSSPARRISISSTTTYYISGAVLFNASTVGGCGQIWARRAR